MEFRCSISYYQRIGNLIITNFFSFKHNSEEFFSITFNCYFFGKLRKLLKLICFKMNLVENYIILYYNAGYCTKA